MAQSGSEFTRQCMQCGKTLELSEAICPHCGATLSRKAAATINQHLVDAAAASKADLNQARARITECELEIASLDASLPILQYELDAQEDLLNGRLSEKSLAQEKEVASNPKKALDECLANRRQLAQEQQQHLSNASQLEELLDSQSSDRQKLASEAEAEKLKLRTIQQIFNSKARDLRSIQQERGPLCKKKEKAEAEAATLEKDYKEKSDLLAYAKERAKGMPENSSEAATQIQLLERESRDARDKLAAKRNEILAIQKRLDGLDASGKDQSSEVSSLEQQRDAQKKQTKIAQDRLDSFDGNMERIRSAISTERHEAGRCAHEIDSQQNRMEGILTICACHGKHKHQRDLALAKHNEVQRQIDAVRSRTQSLREKESQDRQALPALEKASERASLEVKEGQKLEDAVEIAEEEASWDKEKKERLASVADDIKAPCRKQIGEFLRSLVISQIVILIVFMIPPIVILIVGMFF